MKSYALALVPAVLWPIAALLLFLARFGAVGAEAAAESVVFAPMGLVSGLVLVSLWRRAAGRARRIGALVGYIVAVPLAAVAALSSGLLLPPVPGTLLYGTLPLAAASALGYWIGGRLGRRPPAAEGRSAA